MVAPQALARRIVIGHAEQSSVRGDGARGRVATAGAQIRDHDTGRCVAGRERVPDENFPLAGARCGDPGAVGPYTPWPFHQAATSGQSKIRSGTACGWNGIPHQDTVVVGVRDQQLAAGDRQRGRPVQLVERGARIVRREIRLSQHIVGRNVGRRKGVPG